MRIVDATWIVDDKGDPVNAVDLMGEVLKVADACPTSSGDGWLIAVETLEDEDTEGYIVNCWLPQEALERADPPEGWESEVWSPWEDCVSLALVTNVVSWEPEPEIETTQEVTATGETIEVESPVWPVTAEDVAAEAIAEAAKRALEDLVEAERVEEYESVSDGEQTEIHVSVYSPKDLLAAYERIISAPDRAWSHGENSHGFLESRWESPVAERLVFLTPGIESATVTCERWTSPERLHRRSPS